MRDPIFPVYKLEILLFHNHLLRYTITNKSRYLLSNPSKHLNDTSAIAQSN